MHRLLVFLAALIAAPVSAATITSATCTSSNITGCSTSYVPSSSGLAVQVSGTWVGVLTFEGSNDQLAWSQLVGTPSRPGALAESVEANGSWLVWTAGLAYVRVRATAWTSGTATVTPRAVNAPPPPDLVRVVGPTSGSVQVSGAVDAALTQQTLDVLNPRPRPCELAPTVRIALTSTPTAVPRLLPDGGYPALSGRTLIHAINSDDKDRIVCDRARADGGLPDCAAPTLSVDGNGVPLFPNGGNHDFELADNVRLYCTACVSSGTAELTYGEDGCAE